MQESSTKNEADQDENSSDRVLNPTFHDVEIKLVQIINPNTSTVKFNEHHHYREDYDPRKYEKPLAPSEFDYTGKQLGSQENGINERVIENQRKSEVIHQGQKVQEQSVQAVPVTTLPIDSNLISSPTHMRLHSRAKDEEELIHHHRILKQKHREEMLLKKQQIVDTFNRNRRRFSGKRRGSSQESRYFEVAPGIIVAERPVSRNPPNTSPFESRKYFHSEHKPTYENRAATVPTSRKTRIWTGNRSGSSRVMSSVSSRWKMEEPALPKPNLFIKMPFKQVPCITMDAENYKYEDELVLPGDDLRATTAFALSRIRHAFKRMPPPNGPPSRQGRLVKAKLKPMRPVPAAGPNITACRGVQPESKKVLNRPSSSRLRYLKGQYLEACRRHGRPALQEEYNRRTNAHSAASDHSLHRTSPQPYDQLEEDDPDYQNISYPLILHDDSEHHLTREDSQHQQFMHRVNCREDESLNQKLAAMRLESNVIY